MPVDVDRTVPRITVLGCPVDVIDVDGAARWIAERVDAHRGKAGSPPALVVTLNPEMVMRSRRDPAFAAIVRGADLLIADGIGVVRAMRRRGHPEATRTTGADLVERYAALAARRGDRLAFAGAGPGVADRAAEEMRRRHPTLQLSTDGGDDTHSTALRLAAEKPEVVFAAFGAGRQERFLVDQMPAMGAAVGVGVGGTFDYLAGEIRRAPRQVQRLGLEWLWRLVREPSRWRRQLVLPAFWWLERRERRAGS